MSKFDITEAREKANAIIEAEAELTLYLRECFPIGARCGVLLKHGQKNPTPSTIVSVSASIYGGDVLVLIDTAKPFSRIKYRQVYACDVLNVVAKPADIQEKQ